MSFFNLFKSRMEAYSTVSARRKILRDYLSIDRTILSNQNTFLAYLRTALTLFVSGVTFIHFFDSRVLWIVGWTFIPIGVLTAVIGLIRYNRLRIVLKRIWGTSNVPPYEPPKEDDEQQSP